MTLRTLVYEIEIEDLSSSCDGLELCPATNVPDAFSVLRCDIGCCTNQTFLTNSGRPAVYWQQQQQQAESSFFGGKNETTRGPQVVVTSCQTADATTSTTTTTTAATTTTSNGLRNDDASKAELLKNEAGSAKEPNATDRLISEPPLMTSSSAEPGIDNLNKAFQHPPHTMIYRARDVGCRHHLRMDSLKRKRRQSAVAEKQYSTWHDKYAKIDRFFLISSPIFFGVFNLIYWGYFYIWNEVFHQDEGEDYF